MKPEEIRDKINFNNKMIEKLVDPSIFILQPKIEAYLKENDELRKICAHEFVDGVCVYCGKEE